MQSKAARIDGEGPEEIFSHIGAKPISSLKTEERYVRSNAGALVVRIGFGGILYYI